MLIFLFFLICSVLILCFPFEMLLPLMLEHFMNFVVTEFSRRWSLWTLTDSLRQDFVVTHISYFQT